MAFLPLTKEEMLIRGWEQPDFIIVTGDAYVDHPSFGTAIISRVLEAEGFKVVILSQPTNDNHYKTFGTPRLAFMVSAGNIDSMVANYTAAKRKRNDDAYSAGNKAGKRPDRALTVYCNNIKRLFPNTPIIAGGLEASLRRFANYDYWADEVYPSVLVDSKADLLTYGMGENQTIQIAHRLNSGEDIKNITDIKGTCYLTDKIQGLKNSISIPSFEQVKSDKIKYAQATRIELDEQDAVRGKTLIQKHGNMFLVQNPPMPPLKTEELDRVYSLPFERYYHPSYEALGGVPAIEEVEFSITHNRGCFGACNFCSIAFHQGRAITCRSKESIIDEANKLTKNPHFKGYIHDIGGPTANFRIPSCEKQKNMGMCPSKKCLAPRPCPALKVDHSEYLDILRTIRSIPKIKKVFIRSGIRYDYLLEDKNKDFLNDLIKYHVSGQLKVAPEHCSAAVLDKMGKPHIEAYLRFSKEYFKITKSIGKEQYLVPYLMSSHPGCTLKDAIELAEFLRDNKIRPQQVQDFYPTPGTISTCMYYTGLDPYTLKPVFVPKSLEDKKLQRALLQYFKPENKELVLKALISEKRYDLIGKGPKCLIDAPFSRPNNKRQDIKKPHKKVSHKWEPKKRK